MTCEPVTATPTLHPLASASSVGLDGQRLVRGLSLCAETLLFHSVGVVLGSFARLHRNVSVHTASISWQRDI